MSNAKFGAKEVMDVVLYDMETNKPVIQFDSLKTSSISVTSEKVYARGGKGNPKLITWEINKEATLTIESGRHLSHRNIRQGQLAPDDMQLGYHGFYQ